MFFIMRVLYLISVVVEIGAPLTIIYSHISVKLKIDRPCLFLDQISGHGL